MASSSKRYQVVFHKKAEKALEKMDPFVKQVVVSWIRNKLDGCANPRQFGKPLQGELTGLWRYRVANYRIVARIDDDRILILILNVGDRKSVYRFKIPRIK